MFRPPARRARCTLRRKAYAIEGFGRPLSAVAAGLGPHLSGRVGLHVRGLGNTGHVLCPGLRPWRRRPEGIWWRLTRMWLSRFVW